MTGKLSRETKGELEIDRLELSGLEVLELAPVVDYCAIASSVSKNKKKMMVIEEEVKWDSPWKWSYKERERERV